MTALAALPSDAAPRVVGGLPVGSLLETVVVLLVAALAGFRSEVLGRILHPRRRLLQTLIRRWLLLLGLRLGNLVLLRGGNSRDQEEN